MPRYAWIAGALLGWASCTGSGGGGGGMEPGEEPEQRMQEMRACILQRLPPAEAMATEWRVSGYVLVDSYVKCLEDPGQETVADFQSVVQAIAQPDADPSRVRITASPGAAP